MGAGPGWLPLFCHARIQEQAGVILKDMKCLNYDQAVEVFDAVKTYNDSTYAKPSKITARIGLTADGTGYEVELPWFEITSGIITDYGTNTYRVPQLFETTEDGEGLTLINDNTATTE